MNYNCTSLSNRNWQLLLQVLARFSLGTLLFLHYLPVFAFDNLVKTTPSAMRAVAEEGMSLFRNFLPKEYAGDIQNWAVTQTPEGLIYIGNTDGVLEFDGVNWRLIPISNQTIARSLAVDPQSGRVYVGGVGEFGYLEADNQGKMQYVSMLQKIDLAERDFADVWQTFYTPQGVYFSTFQRLFRINDQGVKSWNSKTSFHFSFQVDDRIFVRETGRGLMELIDDQLVLLTGTERFADERIYGVVAFPDENSKDLLLVTRTQGLFIYQDKILSSWQTPIDQYLKRDLLYAAAWLPGGRLGLCTLQGGVYLIDNSGKWLKTLSTENGLPDNAATALKVDNEGGVWIALSHGITRINAGNAITHYNSSTGLERGAIMVQRFNEDLYVGTNQGLFLLKPGANAHIVPVPGIQNQTWHILPINGRLLIGNYLGLYELIEGEAKLVFPFDTVFALYPAKEDKRVFVAMRRGIGSIRLENGEWVDEGSIQGIDDEIRTIQQTENNDLWLGTYNKGVIRVKFSPGQKPQVNQYGVAEGLPNNNLNMVEQYEGAPLFLTQGGIYAFDENTQRFNPDPRFVNLFNGETRETLAIANDPELGFWLISNRDEFPSYHSGLAARQADGRFVWQRKMLTSLDKFTQNSIHRDHDGVLWFSGNEGLFRVDPQQTMKDVEPFNVLLRKVTSGDGKVIYAGAGKPPILDAQFEDNRLRFEFAALTFNELDENRYQVKLIGADAKWSPKSKEAFKDYSNLWEGNYELWVRAMNQQGVLQESKIYEFTVLSPWYRSLLAYFSYILILIASVWFLLRWRLGRLQAQKRMLRNQVEERTRQLAMLGKIGRDITATLDLDAVLESVYSSINKMLDASVFGIGLYQAEKQEIVFRLAIEKGQRYKPYVRNMQDKNQLAVWCIDNKEAVIIGDFSTEYTRYFPDMETHSVTLNDGTKTEPPLSILYVPILLQQSVVGVLTVQSFKTHAYRAQHIDLLQTLASYTAIAIDNSRAHEELLVAYKTMEEVSVTDQLTGLKNRRFLNQYIENDINKLTRDYGNCIRNGNRIEADESVHIFFIIDLDHFKQVNDTYGHAAGDLVLIQIKELLSEVFRGSDFLIRWGGEEFLSIARFTCKACGETLAERVRSAIEQHQFDIGEVKKINMTASIGFAVYPFYANAHELLSWQEVVKIADQCLYYAKNNQRNAWVGGAANESLSTEGLLQLIQNEPQELLKTSYIELTTSIVNKTVSIS